MEIRSMMAPAAERLAAVPEVRAVAVVGSHASGTAGDGSDVDLFIYVDEMTDELSGARSDVAADLAERSQPVLHGVPGHPNTDAWVDRRTGVWLDAMYWTTSWADDELDWRLLRHAPKTGYTTAFWRSIRTGIPLFERDDWHQELQRRAASPYPDELRDATMGLNRRLIGSENPFSFRHQAEGACARGDGVAVQNALTKWLASYFDALFAANRVLHPGEKRLTEFAERECSILPAGFPGDIDELVRLAAGLDPTIAPQMDRMAQQLPTS